MFMINEVGSQLSTILHVTETLRRATTIVQTMRLATPAPGSRGR